MPTTAPERMANSRLQVAVGVLRRRDRLVLMQQRTAGRPCAGQWEFPGGKIEAGESPARALRRELKEELGAEVLRERPLMQLPFDYAHARVQLEVFLVDEFVGDLTDDMGGDITGKEGQPIRWLTLAQIRVLDVLQAVHPILAKLENENLIE